MVNFQWSVETSSQPGKPITLSHCELFTLSPLMTDLFLAGKELVQTCINEYCYQCLIKRDSRLSEFCTSTLKFYCFKEQHILEVVNVGALVSQSRSLFHFAKSMCLFTKWLGKICNKSPLIAVTLVKMLLTPFFTSSTSLPQPFPCPHPYPMQLSSSASLLLFFSFVFSSPLSSSTATKHRPSFS